MARSVGLHLRAVRTKSEQADDASPAVTPPAVGVCLVLAPTCNNGSDVTRSYLVRFDFAAGETCDVEEWLHNETVGDTTPWGAAPIATLNDVVPGKVYEGAAVGACRIYHRVINRTDAAALVIQAEELG